MVSKLQNNAALTLRVALHNHTLSSHRLFFLSIKCHKMLSSRIDYLLFTALGYFILENYSSFVIH